ncbi:ATPase [Thiohalocapsa halophila]|uniref:ATPase n=1 Tax=Thiohalocapsa halophila TaxID=69359 RepID=A0ABS1CFT8_9GAMM|nr:V-type ATP synthase subunit F [Thiohalocapsa halophila]MBK1630583.1 ATPase [Thiohalocapsa halophila]
MAAAPDSASELPATRMLFLGADSLADGFRLIGFEAHANPSPEDVDQIFRQLHQSRDKAFVIVDEDVMRSGAANLARVRREGGRVVVIAVPPLAGPVQLESEVADRLQAMFGSSQLGS